MLRRVIFFMVNVLVVVARRLVSDTLFHRSRASLSVYNKLKSFYLCVVPYCTRQPDIRWNISKLGYFHDSKIIIIIYKNNINNKVLMLFSTLLSTREGHLVDLMALLSNCSKSFGVLLQLDQGTCNAIP